MNHVGVSIRFREYDMYRYHRLRQVSRHEQEEEEEQGGLENSTALRGTVLTDNDLEENKKSRPEEIVPRAGRE